MANIARRVAGWKAQRLGSAFEDHFKIRARMLGLEVTDIPDGCRTVGRQLVRCKSPFDFVLHGFGRSVFLDLKRNESPNFPKSKITPHQVLSLIHASTGGRAGYLCDLDGQVVFFHAQLLFELLNAPGSGSLKVEDGEFIGVRGAMDLRKLFQFPPIKEET